GAARAPGAEAPSAAVDSDGCIVAPLWASGHVARRESRASVDLPRAARNGELVRSACAEAPARADPLTLASPPRGRGNALAGTSRWCSSPAFPRGRANVRRCSGRNTTRHALAVGDAAQPGGGEAARSGGGEVQAGADVAEEEGVGELLGDQVLRPPASAVAGDDDPRADRAQLIHGARDDRLEQAAGEVHP